MSRVKVSRVDYVKACDWLRSDKNKLTILNNSLLEIVSLIKKEMSISSLNIKVVREILISFNIPYRDRRRKKDKISSSTQTFEKELDECMEKLYAEFSDDFSNLRERIFALEVNMVNLTILVRHICTDLGSLLSTEHEEHLKNGTPINDLIHTLNDKIDQFTSCYGYPPGYTIEPLLKFTK